MGIIRGRHISPGIYTKTFSIRTDFINSDLLYANTKNTVVNRGAHSPFAIYFGYYPLQSVNGMFTEESLIELSEKDLSEIVMYSGIHEYNVSNNEIHINDGENITIPKILSEKELRNEIESGISTYNEIADRYNNCILFIAPKFAIHEDIYINDETLYELPISDKFIDLGYHMFNGSEHILLCMLNYNYSYSRIGIDKVISPLEVLF